MQHDLVASYLSGTFHKIDGWCSHWLWQAITPIAERQADLGIMNPVAEIGVFRGKFLLGLLMTKGAPANNFAIDVFDMQQFNLDGAGDGNLELLRASIALAGLDDDRVQIMRADSMTVGTVEIEHLRAASGGFSLFSVDGCHLAEHTMNDIRIAMQVTVPEGIIFVDDYTNFDWPGVQEAVARIYLLDRPRFVPLLIMHNKLFLAHISWHSMWLKLLKEHSSSILGTHIKRVSLFGYETLNVVPDMSGRHDFFGRPTG